MPSTTNVRSFPSTRPGRKEQFEDPITANVKSQFSLQGGLMLDLQKSRTSDIWNDYAQDTHFRWDLKEDDWLEARPQH